MTMRLGIAARRPRLLIAGGLAAIVLTTSAGVASSPAPAAADPPGTNVNLISWGGKTLSGQDGGSVGTDTPAAVHLPAGTTVVQVSAGEQYALALSSAGEVYAWGENGFGEIGVAPAVNEVPTPTRVEGLPADVVTVAAGGGGANVSSGNFIGGLSLAVTRSGEVWAWGQNRYGELGIAPAPAQQLCAGGLLECRYQPAKVPLPAGIVAVGGEGSIAAGETFALVITTDAATHTTRGIYAWGFNGGGEQCFTGGGPAAGPQPVPLPADVTPASVAAGAHTTLIRTTTNNVLGCGLYPGDTNPAASSGPVDAILPAGEVEEVAVRGFTARARLTGGSIWSWGENSYQPLGNGSTDLYSLTPVAVTMPINVGAAHLAVGGTATLFTTSSGAVYGWGQSDALPDRGATSTMVLTPALQTSLPSGTSAATAAMMTAGDAGFVVVRAQPSLTAASPPLTASAGTLYEYRFAASGYPVPAFSLAPGAPPWLSIDTATGVVSGTPPDGGSATYSVIASNGTGGGDTITAGPFTVTISADPTAPAIVDASPPAGTVGTAYGGGAGYRFTASGYPSPTFDVASGQLPDGLTLAADGLLSGTPTAGGPFTFTIRAANGVAPSAVSGTVAIEIGAAPVFTDTSPSAATYLVPYTYVLKASGYPSPQFTVTPGSHMPAWLHLDANGTLHGTPPNVDLAPATFRVRASNASGLVDSPAIGVVMNPPDAAPTLTYNLAPDRAVEGQDYSASFNIYGWPVPDVTVDLVPLPAAGDWLSAQISGQTLTISGAPPAGTTSFQFTVHAGNGIGSPASLGPYTVQVDAAPAFTSPATTPYTVSAAVGLPVDVPLIVAGRPTPMVTHGPFPAWLSLSGSAPWHVSGTPPGPVGAVDVTINASNGIGSDAVLTLHIVVSDSAAPPVPTVSTTSVRWSRGDGADNPIIPVTHTMVAGADHYAARRQVLSYRSAVTGAFPTATGWTDAAWVLTFPFEDGELRRGDTACYEVQAIDAAGNVSAWSAPACTTLILDDRALARSGTAWKAKKPKTTYFDDTYLTTTVKGASLSIRNFHGRRLALYAVTCPTCGAVTVTVGAKKVGTISLRAARQRLAYVELPAFAYRAGTVKLTTTSAKTVTIDGIGLSHR